MYVNRYYLKALLITLEEARDNLLTETEEFEYSGGKRGQDYEEECQVITTMLDFWHGKLSYTAFPEVPKG